MAATIAKTFSVADIVIFCILLLVSVSIGVFFAFRNRKKNTTASYFFGDRNLNFLPVALSFVVTFQSSILILGFPAEAYAYGMQYSLQAVGVMAAYILGALVVVPIFHPLRVTSVYQYYSLRYHGDNSVRLLAAAGGILYYTLYMSVVLYGTAMALAQVTGLPAWLAVVMFAAVAVVYTSVGGLQAVIWTDVFQCAVMVVGILAVLIKSTLATGGAAKVLELSHSRFNFFYFNPDPTIRHTFWTLIIGSISQFFYLTISQSSFQRINSTPTVRAAQTMMYVSTPVFIITWVLAMFEGVTLYAYYTNKGCDPLASGDLSNVNQLIPYSMLELFYNMPGFPGCVIAALAAAALSTISSGLSSLAAVAYEDIVKQIRPNISESTATNISRLIVVAFGMIATALSFLLMHSQGPLGQLFTSFSGAIDGPQVGLFLTSIMFRKARPRAMLAASFIGVAFVLWIGSGQNFFATIPAAPYLPLGPTDQCPLDETIANYTDLSSSYNTNNFTLQSFHSYGNITTEPTAPSSDRSALESLYSISYMYFNLIGCVLVAVLGVVFSLLTQPEEPAVVDERLLFSLAQLRPCGRQRDRKTGDVEKEMENFVK